MAVVEALHQNIIKRCNSQFLQISGTTLVNYLLRLFFRLQSINVTEFDDGNFSL